MGAKRGLPRRRSCPRLGVFRVGRLCPTKADHRTLPRRLSRDFLDRLAVDPGHGRQVGPLLIARQGLELVVEEHGVPLLPGPALQGQCDQVAKAAPRHAVLAREQPIVGIHAELVSPRHRLGDQIAAHPSGDHGRDRLLEEEPNMGAVPRTRPLHRGGKTDLPARRDERQDVLRPSALVEVDRQEPAGFVIEERVHSHDLPALQVCEHRRIVDRNEGLVRAFPALDLRKLADAPYELVRAGRRVPRLAGLPAHKARREDVYAATEEPPKQADFLPRIPRHRLRRSGRELHMNPGRSRLLRRKFLPKRSQASPGLPLLSFEAGKQGFSLLDLPDQLVLSSHRPPSARLWSVYRTTAELPRRTSRAPEIGGFVKDDRLYLGHILKVVERILHFGQDGEARLNPLAAGVGVGYESPAGLPP